MLKNHIKIAWRTILKHKGVFSINTIGLALGIASCMIIFLFVFDELSYDRYNTNADDIVTVVFRAKVSGEDIKEGAIMAPVGTTLKHEFPEVVDATRIKNYHTPKITVDNQSFRGEKFAFVDTNFFDVFTLPIIEGNEKNPLEEPNTAVITQEQAQKLFGAPSAIGKLFYLDGNEEPFRVTAVIKEVPKNSHFHFDIFASMVGFEEAQSDSWFGGSFYTYLLLQKNTDYKNLEAKLPAIVDKYIGSNIQAAMGISYEEFVKENQLGFKFLPLTKIHLHSDNDANDRLEQGGDIKYVYIFSAIALFMLVIACINFINLSTATASKRAKEVGIRKVLGSNKNQLLHQFLSESFIATLFAMLLALALVVVSIPYYNELSGKEMKISYLGQPLVLISLLLLTLLVSLLAGGYPAFFLSSFKPITAIKNKFLGGKNDRVRSGLVVFQFIISAGLILTTLVVNQQMQFIQDKDIGYERDQLLVIREAHLLGNDQNAFKNELFKNPKVASISQSAFVPAGASDDSQTLIFNEDQFVRRMPVYNVDENYIPTMGMQLVSGRNFSKGFGADSTNIIINETAAKVLGLGENALGKSIRVRNNATRTIIGVVKDFHFKSLHQPIDPLFMMYAPYGGLIIKAKTTDMAGLISDAESLWNSFGSDEQFGYTLLDESYQQTYVTEYKMGTVLNVFALLTIFVACLGLFGLITFTAEQRFKEIGIRKVLGSSVTEIVLMLSKDFSKLIFISFIVAFPVGYYLMGKWLESFAYRIEIQWWVFVLAGCMTLVIALGTIGWKSIQAATMNPVKALKDE